MRAFQPSIGRPEPLQRRDHREVARLFRLSPQAHTHIDWRTLEEWVHVAETPQAEDGSVLDGWLVRQDGDIRSVLAATVHQTPQGERIAWLRFILPGTSLRQQEVLDALWGALSADLRERGVGQVALIIMDRWVTDFAAGWGFTETNAVVTRRRRQGPEPPPPDPPLVMREVRGPAELDGVVRVDQAAFHGIWQYGRDTLAAAQREAATFSRLERDGQTVGYQLSTRHAASGHLARLAVLPEAQGQGYGRLLIGHLLRFFEERGISLITVNTQEDNIRSLRLYTGLGFEFTGHRAPVWTLDL